MSDQFRQAAQQALEALKSVQDHKPNNETNAAITALRTALEQPEQWNKPSASFNEWWNRSYVDSANPFEIDSAAYWAWAGWQAAQRPWVGLTDDEIDIIYQGAGKHDLLNARAIEAKLKERNT